MNTEELIIEAIKKCYDYLKNNKFLEAKIISHQTTKVDPNCYEAYLIMGICFLKEENFDQAIKCFLKSSEENSLKESSYNNLSVCFAKINDSSQSVDYILRCLQINPTKDYYWSQLGFQYKKLNLNNEAEKAFSKAILLNESAINYANYGAFLADNNKHEDAKIYFEKSIKLDKNFIGPYVDLFHIYALSNKYNHKLWKLYEKRYDLYDQLKWTKNTGIKIPNTLQECYGKNNVIFCEQGFGDTIMFLRYLKKIPSKLKFQILCGKEMNEVFSLMKIKTINSLENTNFDRLISLMSLPYLLKLKDIPKSYFPVQNKLKKFNKNIGICWCGSPAHAHDKFRSIDYNKFSEIFPDKEFNYFSLVKNYSKRIYLDSKETFDFSKGVFDNKKLNHFGDDVISVMDTVNYILKNKITLVITVDTMIAHLCGSMGIKTLVILSKKCDWRWGLLLNNKWYGENVKIFRQDNLNDWNPVLKKIKEYLENTP